MSDHSISEDRTVPMDFIQQLHSNPIAFHQYGKLSSQQKKAYVGYIEEITDSQARQKRINEIMNQLTAASK